MRISILVLILISSSMASCYWLQTKPDLSEEERIDLWIDLHTVQMLAQNSPSDQRDSIEALHMDQVARHYGMNVEQLERFMESMKEKPEEMLRLYDTARDSIKRLENNLRKQEEE